MAYKTFSALIQDTIIRLSQVPGTSVQTYSETRIGEMIQHKFDVLFDENWWPQFVDIAIALPLDETTGKVTTVLSTMTNALERHDDIHSIYISTATTPLPRLPLRMNPTLITGSRPQYLEMRNDDTRFFRVWPLTSTGNLVMRYRTKPDDFTGDEEVRFDGQALVLGACFDYLEDDGSNPGQIEKFERFFNDRVQQLTDNLNSQDIVLDSRHPPDIPQQWFTA